MKITNELIDSLADVQFEEYGVQKEMDQLLSGDYLPEAMKEALPKMLKLSFRMGFLCADARRADVED